MEEKHHIQEEATGQEESTDAVRSGAATRKKLLAAAREALIEAGHQSATVKEIARRAGVNHGLVHHYFKSKEALFVELLESEDTYSSHGLVEALRDRERAVQFLKENLFSMTRLRVEFHSLAVEMPEVKEALLRNIRINRSVVKEGMQIEDDALVSLIVAATSGLVLHAILDENLPIETILGRLYDLTTATPVPAEEQGSGAAVP